MARHSEDPYSSQGIDPALFDYTHSLGPSEVSSMQYSEDHRANGQNHLTALAHGLLKDRQGEVSVASTEKLPSKDGLLTSEPFNDGLGTFGLPLTNLARMSADTALGSGNSYFSHQFPRSSTDGLQGSLMTHSSPSFQYADLSRHSAGSMLPVSHSLAMRGLSKDSLVPQDSAATLRTGPGGLQAGRAGISVDPDLGSQSALQPPQASSITDSSSSRNGDGHVGMPDATSAAFRANGSIYSATAGDTLTPTSEYGFAQQDLHGMAFYPGLMPMRATEGGHAGAFDPGLDMPEGINPSLEGDGQEHMTSANGGTDDANRQRERNRNAQKRFRQRQKERMKDSQEQLQLLTQQMSQLMQEKAELETRNKILEQVVRLNVEHVDQLQTNKQVLDIEQSMLLEAYTQFVSKVEQKPKESVEEAKKWLMGQLLQQGFQVYIDRLEALYNQASRDPQSSAHRELHDLIVMRREHEKQGALFSCFYWAVYSWNMHETKKRQAEIPPMSHWHDVMVGLQLSREQETEILTARRRMLTRLLTLVEQRKAIISRLGLQMLQTGREKLHSCPAVLELRKSLEAEREAVFYFLFTAVDETLTPAQEAYLDIRSYPWCPDLHAISELMAERRKEPKIPTPDLDFGGAVLAPILPHASGFQILTAPITAIGIGMRLKRGMLMCPPHCVAPKAAFPLPTQKQLENRTLLAIQCGAWKKYHHHEWQARCVIADDLVTNELSPDDEGYVAP